MAEEKPHEATAGKLRKARREGNVSKSAELNTAFAASAMTALSLIPKYVPLITSWIHNAAYSKPFSWEPVIQITMLSLIPMVVTIAVTAVLTVIQTQGPAPKPLKFDLKKLNPFDGIKKLFSKEGLINAVRAFIGFIIAVMMVSPVLEQVFQEGIMAHDVYALALIARDAISAIVNKVFLLGVILGGVDFFMSFKRWKDQLKMTFEEIKRESKENNGDPQIKGKRKQMHRQFLRGAPTRVKDASVVVTNPTHFAVALEYNPPSIPVPRIICAAADEMAFEVRKLANLHGVPIVENVQLARDLFARGKLGRDIPEDTFVAVAEIVAALLKDSKDGKIQRQDPVMT
jgi:flagellar biosynthesis protein FlhB